ncbi:hypothetical protein DFS34DRAFT_54183 [Phlyctochytrium arcticum]|nr:hypothetical protein DFS34DRAFT_54183 [Phlyctochytrium arcticum]
MMSTAQNGPSNGPTDTQQTKKRSASSLFSSLPPTKSSLFGSLPPPKHSISRESQDDKPEKERKRVKIYVDLPAESPPVKKDVKKATESGESKSQSLFAMLPQPKRAENMEVKSSDNHASSKEGTSGPELPKEAVVQLTTVSMVPHTVSKKKSATKSAPASSKPPIARPPKEEVDDSDSFFTLTAAEPEYDAEAEAELFTTMGPSLPSHQDVSTTDIPYATADEYAVYQSSDYTYEESSASGQYAYNPNSMYAYTPEGAPAVPYEDLHQTGPQLSEAEREAILQSGARDLDGIDIQEVSTDQLIDKDSYELEQLRNQSRQHAATSAGLRKLGTGSSGGRHSLKSLAYQASSQAAALTDLASRRAAGKQASRAKYGF